MSFWAVAVVASAVLYVLYKYGTRHYDHWEKKGIGHIKPSLPFIGNSRDLILNKISAAENLIKVYNEFSGQRFGGVFMLRRPVLLLRDPDIIRNVMVKDFDHFVNRALLIDPDADPLFGKNLSVLKGQVWKDMRNTLSPMFTSAKMKSMLALINAIGQQMTDHLDGLIASRTRSGHPGVPEDDVITLEFKDFFRRFTIDVIATCAFGVEIDSLKDRENQFYTMGVKVVNLKGVVFLKYILCFMFPALVKPKQISIAAEMGARCFLRRLCSQNQKTIQISFQALKMKVFGEEERKFYTDLVQKSIKVRKENNINRPDLIHQFMQLRSEEASEKRQSEVTDDEITAQAVVFFLAGFETVATSLSFTAYELALREDIQSRLQEEIDRVTAEEGGRITYEGVMHKMKYLDMVINESLRKWPPTILTNRTVTKRYVIPKTDTSPELVLDEGEHVWIPIIASHRNPDFFPNPDLFDPERFGEENKNKITPFSYFPFGTGPRGCIGNRFGIMELKTCVAHLLHKYSFKVVARTDIPLKLSRANQSLTAEKGFWLGLKPRGRRD